jgi:PadR family transcriptional regulator PadR
MNAQYKKGVLELCVLSLLARGDRYGYEISESLSARIDIADGTVYPILRKLKADGFLTTYLQEESGGPPRKYYHLTDEGRAAYSCERREYLDFSRAIESILEEDGHDEE